MMASPRKIVFATVAAVGFFALLFVALDTLSRYPVDDDAHPPTALFSWFESPPPAPSAFTGGSYAGGDSLGSNIVHTLATEDATFATTATDAIAAGYVAQNNGDCLADLGVLYELKGGPTQQQPLSGYYTPAGQLAGMKITIWGTDATSFGGTLSVSAFEGPAALGNMVAQGFYTAKSNTCGTSNDAKCASWEMSVSFRSSSDVCSKTTSSMDIGDRLVINQHTIKYSVPMTAGEVASNGWQAGSCMAKMGQHWFKDLVAGGTMSWVTGNLLPVTPMYYPVGDPNGKLNAFFFSTPACQDDKVDTAWDNVPGFCALPAGLMCANYCNEDCPVAAIGTPWKNPSTYRYGTLHVFFNTKEGLTDVNCPGASDINPLLAPVSFLAGRTCPANTPSPDKSTDDCSSWNIFRIGC